MERIDGTAAWALLRRCKLQRDSVAPGILRLDGQEAVRVFPDGTWEALLPVNEAARAQLDLYLPLVLQPRYTIAQLGQSLDGHIATNSGHSRYVTGAEDIRHLHRLRALVDAVIVGPGTVAADDPRLTVRNVPGEQPVRVVLDPSGRLRDGYQLFCDGAAPTLLLRGEGLDPGPTGVEVLTLPAPEGAFAPADVTALLAERGLQRLLVEGGGVTVSRFLAEGALDRLHVTVAPLVIGSGRPGLSLPPIRTMDEAMRPTCRNFRLGDDVLFDFTLSSVFGAGP
ncbi:RibD family protein [Aquisalimonas sp. 2447]|uniref:RibD family protein n=1 Tax=Aquisalimonas sp. 2447 TaxID=2740807 RepID=UPI0014323C4D|nr:RibD family protein [Aquisalimonas sp. 2447]